ncbi:hypothetical protein [Verrucomicrobium spinosum]|uniref:hypothetical protein n=1 Tax=Verrucomicrobium spinosum TaxID=2736 RepID=UPI000B2AF4F8|nr:hypothetical protein [Verrucomicrobium spinosum]
MPQRYCHKQRLPHSRSIALVGSLATTLACLPLTGVAAEPATPAKPEATAASVAPVPVSTTTAPAAPGAAQELDTVTVTATAEPPITTVPATTSTGLALTIRETPQSVTIVDRQRIEQEALRTSRRSCPTRPGSRW